MWRLVNTPPFWYVAFWFALFAANCSFWSVWLWVLVHALKAAR